MHPATAISLETEVYGHQLLDGEDFIEALPPEKVLYIDAFLDPAAFPILMLFHFPRDGLKYAIVE